MFNSVTKEHLSLLRQELKNSHDAQDNQLQSKLIEFTEMIKAIRAEINKLSQEIDKRTNLKDLQTEVNKLKTRADNLERVANI